MFRPNFWKRADRNRKFRQDLPAVRRDRNRRALMMDFLEDRQLLAVYTVSTLSDGSATTAGTIRYAITQANSHPGSTVNFSVTGTINIGSTLPALAANVTIQNTQAGSVTLNGGGSSSQYVCLTINSGVTVSISDLIFSNFADSGTDGGAIHNNGGVLSVSASTFSNDSAGFGGAIGNNGTLTILNSSFSGDSAISGGSIENFNSGTSSITGSTFSSDSASAAGGAIDTNTGTVTVFGSTFSADSANNGGAIQVNNANVTVTSSTFTGDSATTNGGAIYSYSGTATVTSSTLAGNSAKQGGGIDITTNGTLKLYDTIVAGNTFTSGGVGPDVDGAIAAGTSDLIGNGAGMTGLSNGSNGNLVGTAAAPFNALLSALGNYGGTTQTLALLPGSPAIDAGDSSASSTDQRGVSRPQGAGNDIGAFESEGFTIAVTSGNSQTALAGSAFANPVVVTVTPKNAAEPVAGGLVTFTAPTSGASATIAGSPATIGSSGTASVTATANATAGSYALTASSSGIAAPASVSLTNAQPSNISLVVNSTSDAATTSAGVIDLREAIASAEASYGTATITFDPTVFATAQTISINSSLPTLSNSGVAVTIQGPAAGVTIAQGTSNLFNPLTINAGVSATLAGLTFSKFNAFNFANGGVITNSGNLTITGSTFSSDEANYGGAIFNQSGGSVTITGSTFSGDTGVSGAGAIDNKSGTLSITNSSFSNDSGGFGGGAIINAGTLTVTGSTFTSDSGNIGGAIYSTGTATVTGSTFTGNAATAYGGAIAINKGTLSISSSTLTGNTISTGGGGALYMYSGTVTVTDCTLTGNSAPSSVGGAIYSGKSLNASSITITSSTITNNSAVYEGGIRNSNYSTLKLYDTIVAGNTATAYTPYPDIATSTNVSGTGNLIGNNQGLMGLTNGTNGNLIGTPSAPIKPMLSALGNYGGATQTVVPLPGSPAIGGGDSHAASVDQRGVARPQGSRYDIGAVQSEGFTIAVTSGSGQFAAPGGAFATPIVVTVTANNPVEPVAGGLVTFTAPASGASATITGSPATIGASGTASITATANSTAGSYVLTATASGVATPASIALTNVGLIVNSTSDAATTAAGVVDLREAVANAEALPGGSATITFSSTVFATAQTITLGSALPSLSNTAVTIAIQGPAAGLTINGGGSSSGFSFLYIGSGVTASISNLNVSNFGNSGNNGGAIFNNGGVLSISALTFSNDSAGFGGAIANTGTLTILNSSFSGDSAIAGGAIEDFNSGVLSITGSTFLSDSASASGGAIDTNTGTVTVSGSTFSADSANVGGAIQVNGANWTVANSTFSGDSATSDGGAIYAPSGTATVTSSTVSGNSANQGGGIDITSNGTVNLYDTIVAGNTFTSGGAGPDVDGAIAAGTSDLIGNGTGMTGLSYGSNGNLVGTAAAPINALLSTLGNYGGTTQTMALLPGSPAIDAGDSSASATDQRGVSRPQGAHNDIGAFESEGFTIAVTSGNSQTALAGSAFAKPIVVTVTPKNAAEPVAGGLVTFTAPTSGASATIAGSPATIGSNGTASVTATANGTVGSFTLKASASGIATAATVSLANASVVVNSTSDAATTAAGVVDLREALSNAEAYGTGAVTITFDPTVFATAQTISINSSLPTLSNSGVALTIQGPAAGVTIAQGTSNLFNPLTINAGVSATLAGLTFSKFNAFNFANGGVITNSGNLTITGSTFSSDEANYGGAIFNQSGGSVTITGSTFSGDTGVSGAGAIDNKSGTLSITNSSFSNDSGGFGGGAIINAGTLTVTGSTFTSDSGNIGGAIYSTGTATVTGSTFTGNAATAYGGAIAINKGTLSISSSTLTGNTISTGGGGALYMYSGTVTVTDCTLTGNSAPSSVGGAIYSGKSLNASSITITSSTITNNSAVYEGGIRNSNYSTLKLYDTIVAGNTATAYTPYPDIATSTNVSGTGNLIGNNQGLMGLTNGTNGNLIGTPSAPIKPMLSALGNYGGATQTVVPLPGSPAIGGGDSHAASVDQRGVARPQGSRYDIGAVQSEGFTIAVTSGGGQSATLGTAFASPLVVTVTANNPLEPVAGGVITFTAPSSGATATISGSPATIGSNGTASASATANLTAGGYALTATATGATTPASFALTNVAQLSDGLDGSGDLTISDSVGSSGNTVSISTSGANLVITNGSEAFGSTSIAGASLSNLNKTLTFRCPT